MAILSRRCAEPYRGLPGGSPPVGPRTDRRRPPPAVRALGCPAGLVKVDCQDGATALGKDHRRRSCGLTFPPREEDDDGAGATAAPSSAHCQSLVFGVEVRPVCGAALSVCWRWCACDSSCRPSPSSHSYRAGGNVTDSLRNRTDLGADCDRSRGGLRPISARSSTDLGERGGRLGRLIAAVACGGPVPTMKSCARRPRGRRGGPSARRRHQPAAIARIQRIQKLAPPPVCRAEVRAGVVVSC